MNKEIDNKETPLASPKPKRFPGWYIIVILFAFYALFIMMPVVGVVYNSEMYSTNLYSVKYDLFNYIEKYHQFPPAEKWCDTLLEEEYPHLEYEIDEKGNSPFILNKHILEHKELPSNMVAAFFGGNESGPETSGRNLVGDVELVKDYDRVAVLFGNGDIHTFRNKQVPYLRWRFEDSGVIPDPDVKIPLLTLSVLLIIIFLAILIPCRHCLKILWILTLGIGVVSAVAGFLLGGMAELIFYKLMDTTGDFLAPWIGSVWGFLVGVCFIALLGKIYKKFHANVNMISYAIVLGPIAGVVASSLIHGYLMIAYEETSFRYMLAGSFFGIVAGGVLGLISGAIIGVYEGKMSIQNEK